eukprot:1648062-Amphidinium_carterae.1
MSNLFGKSLCNSPGYDGHQVSISSKIENNIVKSAFRSRFIRSLQWDPAETVSYTHLTLPTILLV